MYTTKAYDETNPLSIEQYSKKLIGKTFREIFEHNSNQIIQEAGVEYADKHENKNRKGGLGDLIEECFFHYKCNNDSRPDFDKAGVELKVTPYKKNQNGSISAKERLIITMIDYYAVVNEPFEKSHLWEKSKLLLLVYYLYRQEIKNRLDYRIDYAKLFSPPKQDLKIIKHDFQVIVDKIRSGKAHELSESDTLYLGAAPKAATSKDRRKQPYSEVPAKPRAFSFKSSYMTYVLNNYIATNKVTYESILQNEEVDSLEKYVINKIMQYQGFSVEELCETFQVTYKKRPKNLEAMLVYRILGIKGNHAEEFVKANIVLKTIRLHNKNKIKESMSFPTFKFKELVQEEWEESTFQTYLSEIRFLFIIYKFDENQILRLKGCQFWNIPYNDLHISVRNVWEKTREVLIRGLQVTRINGQNYNNFPKASENPVCHVRPHARNAKDTDELPTELVLKGTSLNTNESDIYTDKLQFPKQCFWLNNTYILSQLDKEFLK